VSQEVAEENDETHKVVARQNLGSSSVMGLVTSREIVLS